jgi:outer membrane protein TolC
MRRIAVCLPVLLAASLAHGAAPLTWEECIPEAMERNADLAAAQANLEAAQYKVQAASGGYYPQLTGAVGYSDSSGSAASTSTPTYSTSLSATQNLFAGFQDEAKVEQASANLAAAQANLTSAKAKLSQDLKTAFAGLRHAQNNVQLTEDIARRLEENLRLVELRFESGRENKGSLLLTRATLGQARLEHLQARQALEAAQAQLARVLGRQVSLELRVAGEVPAAEPGPAPDFAGLARATPDYRQVAAQEHVAQADVRLARAGLLPSLNLTGTVAREGGDWYPEGDRRTVGVSLSVPLFSGGKDYYGLKSAHSSLTAAGVNKEGVERQLLVRLRQTYAAYVEAAVKLKVDRDFLEAATTRAAIARARYQNGLMSFEDWDRIENDLIQRQKALLLAQRERVTAEAAWESAQGKGVIP